MKTETKKLDGLELNEWISILDTTVEKFGKESVSISSKTIEIRKEILKELNNIQFVDEYGYMYRNDKSDILKERIGCGTKYNISENINKVIIVNIDIFNNIELGNFEEVNNTSYKKVKRANNIFKKIWTKEVRLFKKLKE